MANPIAGKALSDIEIEEMLAKKALDRSMFSRLLPLLKPVHQHIGGVIGIELLLVFTVFLRPWFVRELPDGGLFRQGDAWRLDLTLVGLLGVGLAATWGARFLLAGLSQYIAGGAAIRVLNDLRRLVFADSCCRPRIWLRRSICPRCSKSSKSTCCITTSARTPRPSRCWPRSSAEFHSP